MSSEALPHLSFTTETLPPAQQFEAWREAVGVTHEVTPPAAGGAAGFAAAVELWHLGPLLLTDGRFQAQRFARTARRARRDGVDHYTVLLMRSGHWWGELDDRAIAVGAGGVCLLDMALPLATEVTASAYLLLMLPRELLDAAGPAAADGHGLAASGVAGALLADHLHALAARLPQMTLADAPAVVQATRHMIAACLVPTPDALARAARPLAASSLRAARRLIETQLENPDLTPDRVAGMLGLSRSTLYRLFAPLGGLGSYIRARRLARVHALLAGPRRQARVADLAYRHGFASEAHFSRAFRREFGYSPREVQAAAPPPRHPPAADPAIAAPAGYHDWVRALRD